MLHAQSEQDQTQRWTIAPFALRASPANLAFVYVLATVIVIDTIVDLDQPRSGFIQIGLQPLVRQLASIRWGLQAHDKL